MLQSICGILPRDIVTVRLGHHVGVITLATVGYQCLIYLVNLVVFLLGRQLISHFLENGITLGILSEGIIIDGLGIEKIILYFLIAGLSGQALQNVKLILGAFTLSEFHIHLQTLFGNQIVRCSFLAGRLLT